MKLLQRIQALGCAALLVGAISAQADVPSSHVTCLFDITWTSGALMNNTSTGSFTYDSSLVRGVGFIDYLGNGSGFISFLLVVDGESFTLANDVGGSSGFPGAPVWPVVIFTDGEFDLLDYHGVGMTSQLNLILGPDSLDASHGPDSEGTIALRRKNATPPTGVPDGGATVSLLAAGLGAITLARRKLKS